MNNRIWYEWNLSKWFFLPIESSSSKRGRGPFHLLKLWPWFSLLHYTIVVYHELEQKLDVELGSDWIQWFDQSTASRVLQKWIRVAKKARNLFLADDLGLQPIQHTKLLVYKKLSSEVPSIINFQFSVLDPFSAVS